MMRNIYLAIVLATLALTGSVSVTAAYGDSPARMARPHKRTVVPTRSHTATSARRHAEGSAHSAVLRRRAYAASSRRRAAGHRVPQRQHAPSARLVASVTPASEVIGLHRAPMLPPSALKGSFESLARQNEMADAEGLERILDENDLADRIAQKLLVPLPESASLAVNGNLPENHKYCRPWTANFLADLAHAHASRWGHPIEVSSAVRTVEYQKHLMHTNGNAAAAEGDVVSPHLTGATVDVAKSGMNRAELSWMRSWLLPLQLAGTIDVEEEFRQACFHITVYKNYVPPPAAPAEKPGRRHAVSHEQVASRSL
jgi:hypothetical protein